MRTGALVGIVCIVGGLSAAGCGGAAASTRGAAAANGARDGGDARGDATRAATSREAAAPDARDGDAPAAPDVGSAQTTAAREERVAARDVAADAAWIGAAAESDVLLAGASETALGVWVDAPPRPGDARRAPIDVALVVDTSGSMGGDKIDGARRAARAIVEALRDGDLVSIDAFSDTATTLLAPTTVSSRSRRAILAQIEQLGASGGTNMFAGLTLGEQHVARAPATHAVRRVVVISDGMANVGPSSPELLGAVAERGLAHHAQVTSLGVGVDYDERTLDALAVRSSGRLYHLSDPREMAATLAHEIDLLDATVASDAVLEVVPAPGVQLLGADGVRAEWAESTGRAGGRVLRLPLGALFGGQHREALVRVRVDPTAMHAGGAARPLASVRLRFRDPAEGDLERVQEVVARAAFTSDAAIVARHENPRTKAIVALQSAAKLEMAASEAVNGGRFDDAEASLRAAEATLAAQAQATTDGAEKRRLAAAASNVSAARGGARAAAAAPRPAQRDEALKMNKAAMDAYGY